MRPERFVVLGLAHPRTEWFGEVGRWAGSALVPMEFIRCVSAGELMAHLNSGRVFSAALIDAGHRSADRDLLGRLDMASCPAILVSHAGAPQRQQVASLELEAPFTATELTYLLESSARPISVVLPASATVTATTREHHSVGALVAVTAACAEQATVAAMAVAQGLAGCNGNSGGGRVVLADFALDSLQGVAHAASDVSPGVQELVEAHRSGALDPDAVLALTFIDDRRCYRVLLGLRRHRDWSSLRPRALSAALVSLRQTFTQSVAQIDPDVEGQEESGSPDIEERNQLARAVTSEAELVIIACRPTLLSIHGLVRISATFVTAGVDPTRIQPLVLDSPTNPATRAGLTRTMADLHAQQWRSDTVAAPIHLAPIRRQEDLLRGAHPFPSRAVHALGSSVAARLAVVGRSPDCAGGIDGMQPAAVTPGSIGRWYDDDAR